MSKDAGRKGVGGRENPQKTTSKAIGTGAQPTEDMPQWKKDYYSTIKAWEKKHKVGIYGGAVGQVTPETEASRLNV